MYSIKKVFLEIWQNLQEKICARVSFLLKKRLWHRSFPVNFVKFLRIPFLHNTSGQLLLRNSIFWRFNSRKLPTILHKPIFSKNPVENNAESISEENGYNENVDEKICNLLWLGNETFWPMQANGEILCCRKASDCWTILR